MKIAACIASLVALTGCVATIAADEPPVREPQGTCRREPGQRFLGMKATADIGREMLAATGATILRWVPPRTAVTMDFNPSRLTVSYDDDFMITKVSCT